VKRLLVALAACSHAQPPAQPAHASPELAPVEEPETFLCVKYAYYVLEPAAMYSDHGTPSSVYPTAQALAEHDVAIAEHVVERGDHHEAALRYLACAGRFRDVPTNDPMWEQAKRNAELCYGNTIWAFANAGALAREGKRLLDRAIVDDPRMADVIRARLVDPPPECRPSPSGGPRETGD